MPNLPTAQLAQLIAQKHQCLRALKELGQRQKVLVEGEELGQLFKLLGTKQQLLNLLQDLERKLEPYRDEHPEHRVWESDETRAACSALAAECPALLAEIVAQEQESEKRMKQRRDITEAQINSARSAGVARQAYVAKDEYQMGSLDLSTD